MSVPGHFPHDGSLVSRVFIQQTFPRPCYVPDALLGLGDREDPGSLWGTEDEQVDSSTNYQLGRGLQGNQQSVRSGKQREAAPDTVVSEIPETVSGEGAAGGEARGEKELKIKGSRFRLQLGLNLFLLQPFITCLPKSLEAPPQRAPQTIGHGAENAASEMVLSSCSHLQPWSGLLRHFLTGLTSSSTSSLLPGRVLKPTLSCSCAALKPPMAPHCLLNYRHTGSLSLPAASQRHRRPLAQAYVAVTALGLSRGAFTPPCPLCLTHAVPHSPLPPRMPFLIVLPPPLPVVLFLCERSSVPFLTVLGREGSRCCCPQEGCLFHIWVLSTCPGLTQTG